MDGGVKPRKKGGGGLERNGNGDGSGKKGGNEGRSRISRGRKMRTTQRNTFGWIEGANQRMCLRRSL